MIQINMSKVNIFPLGLFVARVSKILTSIECAHERSTTEAAKISLERNTKCSILFTFQDIEGKSTHEGSHVNIMCPREK